MKRPAESGRETRGKFNDHLPWGFCIADRPHELVERDNGRWAVRVVDAFRRDGVLRVEGHIEQGPQRTLLKADLPLDRTCPGPGDIIRIEPIAHRIFPDGDVK